MNTDELFRGRTGPMDRASRLLADHRAEQDVIDRRDNGVNRMHTVIARNFVDRTPNHHVSIPIGYNARRACEISDRRGSYLSLADDRSLRWRLSFRDSP